MSHHLAHVLDLLLTKVPERTVATFLERGDVTSPTELTAGALHVLSGRLAETLLEWETSGRPVVLAMAAGPTFLVTLTACIKAGLVAVPVPLPRRGATLNRLASILEDCGATLVLTDTRNLPRLSAFQLEQGGSRPSWRLLDTEVEWSLRDAWSAASSPVGVGGTGVPPVIIQYSSGSTRTPAGVVLNSRNVMDNAALIKNLWRLAEGKVLVNWLPHYHDMGLLGGILYPLLNGASSVQMEPTAFIKKPVRWLQAIGRFRGTHGGGPAFAFAHCLDRISDDDLEAIDLSSWEVAFCGAEPVPSALMDRFRRRFGRHGLRPGAVHACYGLAEATLFVAGERRWVTSKPDSTPPIRSAFEPCLLSVATRDRLRIVDPDTARVLGEDETGEIWVTGDSVADGYLNRPRETDVVFKARPREESRNWLRTGDLGFLHDGNLIVTGRLRDTLIVHGVNVAASDVEWVAGSVHPALNPLAAAVFPLDPLRSAVAGLVIERRSAREGIEDGLAVKKRIRAVVLTEFGVDLRDISIVPRGTLERTTSGKIQRHAVAKRMRGEQSDCWIRVDSGQKNLSSS